MSQFNKSIKSQRGQRQAQKPTYRPGTKNKDRRPAGARAAAPVRESKTPNGICQYLDCILETCLMLPRKITFDKHAAEPLAKLAYPDEILLKQRALELFREKNALPIHPEPLYPSPLGRGYRTNSKRRISFSGKKTSLLIEQRHCPPGTLQASALEPQLHQDVYQLLLELLSTSNYQALARSLNYCILRGSYHECALIMNVHTVDGTVVRKLKQFSSELQRRDQRIISCFMYVDPTRSDYYLESRRPEKGVQFKKLFGPDFLDVTVDGVRFLYPPTAFSQVNESMLPTFTGAIRELLKLDANTILLDLYCGYGLLGLALATEVASVIGMDIEGPAIRAAVNNAKYHFPDKALKYISSPITPDSLVNKLPPPRPGELILLDPPRHGVVPGVIETLAKRTPERILHIFCGVDEIPKALPEWKKYGYEPEHMLPLDMFPGSCNLEIMILLTRAKRRQ